MTCVSNSVLFSSVLKQLLYKGFVCQVIWEQLTGIPTGDLSCSNRSETFALPLIQSSMMAASGRVLPACATPSVLYNDTPSFLFYCCLFCLRWCSGLIHALCSGITPGEACVALWIVPGPAICKASAISIYYLLTQIK